MFNKVISILGTLILLVLAGCRDVAPISVEEPSTENRTITLNLDITTRADNLLPDNSEPDIIRLWICDMNDSIITSIVSSHNVWTPVEETDEEGIDITTTLQTEIEADEINEKSTFKIYLVLNQPFEKDSTTPVDFTNVTSIKELKQKTFVGDNCFIGCNVNLIAPVKIENNSYICAGATVAENIAENNGLGLIMESGETIVVDMEKCIEYANEHNLIFAALKESEL